jgi:DNA-binding response OmpR family regulator
MARVLVVDSQPQLCAVVQRALENTGKYRVSCAFDGDEGAARLEHDRPHLVILDAILPGMPGIELAAEVTERGIPVIVTTNEAELDRRLLRLGWPYLRKPFPERELLAKCRATMAKAQESRRVIAGSLQRLLKSRGEIAGLVARLRALHEQVDATLAAAHRFRH